MKGKKKNNYNFLTIFIVFAFLLNGVINLCLYINDKEVKSLVEFIIYAFALISFLVFLLCIKIKNRRTYIFVYDDCFLIDNDNIIDSKVSSFIKKKKIKRKDYKSNINIYSYKKDNREIKFGLIDISEGKKLMIIYNIKKNKKDNYSIFGEIENNLKNYYLNHEIEPLTGEKVFYKNPRNAVAINYVNGIYKLTRYRYYVPFIIYNIKELLSCNPYWDVLFENEYDSIDEAINDAQSIIKQ